MTGFVVMLEKVCVHVTGFADFNCQNTDDEFVHEHFYIAVIVVTAGVLGLIGCVISKRHTASWHSVLNPFACLQGVCTAYSA